MKSLFFGEVSDKIWESLNFLGDKETIIVYFPIWVQSRELVVGEHPRIMLEKCLCVLIVFDVSFDV